jgi:hypothetical protein
MAREVYAVGRRGNCCCGSSSDDGADDDVGGVVDPSVDAGVGDGPGQQPHRNG